MGQGWGDPSVPAMLPSPRVVKPKHPTIHQDASLGVARRAQTHPDGPWLKNESFCFIIRPSALKAVIYFFFNLTLFLVSPSRKYVWDQLENRGGKKLPEGFSIL